MRFIDPQVGWAACEQALLFTDDGGDSWNSLTRDLPLEFSSIETFFFVNKERGWLSVKYGPTPDADNHLLFTTNGGKTWQELKEMNGVAIHNISFVDNQVGWMSGGRHAVPFESLVGSGVAFKTQDAGRSWQRVTVPESDVIKSIRFTTESAGWLATDYDIYRTNDGGKRWAKVLSYPEMKERNLQVLGRVKDDKLSRLE
jgi:photosystem II stability/assembly factor-like uncharacterized protein